MADQDPLDLAACRADIDRAHTEVGDIAAEGHRRWRMSIPARPDRDSDLLISAGLAHGKRLAEEVERLRAGLTEAQQTIQQVRDRHHARTDRRGSSGCVSCGRLWPCPDYLDAHALIGGQETEPAPERTAPDDGRATCEHAALRPRCLYDRDGRCVMCCTHQHRFSED